jgi:hypothetical protein
VLELYLGVHPYTHMHPDCPQSHTSCLSPVAGIPS